MQVKTALGFLKRNWVTFSIFILYVFILKLVTVGYFPDYFSLSNISPAEYFELIINATASILGILIAVILLTFEFVKNTAFRRKDKNLFSHTAVKNLVSIAICIIILSFLSYSLILDFYSPANLSIGYFIGILFSVFIAIIFPSTKLILGNANTLQITLEDINKLTIENFKEVNIIQAGKFIAKNNEIPLVRIRSELQNAIKDSDHEAYTRILQELNSKVINFLSSGATREESTMLFEGIIFVWKGGNSEALRNGIKQYNDAVWESVEELYDFSANEEYPLGNYREISIFIGDYIGYLSNNDLNDSLIKGVETLSSAFTGNLKLNCPPESEVGTIFHPYDTKKNKDQYNIDSFLQWDSLRELFFYIYRIQEFSISKHNRNLYRKCAFETEWIIRSLANNSFPNLGEFQGGSLITLAYVHQSWNGHSACKTNLYESIIWLYEISDDVIIYLIDSNRVYLGRIMEIHGDFIINSYRNGYLNDIYFLNSIATIARKIASKPLTELSEKTLVYIIEIFRVLKNEIEVASKLEDAPLYKEVKDQLVSIKKWLEDNNEGGKAIYIQDVSGLIDSFVSIDGKTNNKIIPWE